MNSPTEISPSFQLLLDEIQLDLSSAGGSMSLMLVGTGDSPSS
jgi:hypothetical protein